MSGILVPTVRTTYTQSQIIQGFVDGWHSQFGEYPKKESIAVLWAQECVETGVSTSMWNNNVGNVKYSPANGDVEYMMLAHVWEIVGGKKIMIEPPAAGTWFRSFRTLAQGIAFQMDFLKNHRYKAAWAAVESGSVADFAHLLKVAGYYTAPEADYAKAMNYYFKKFMADQTYEKMFEPVPEPIAPVVPTPVIITPVVEQPNQPITIPEVTVIGTVPATPAPSTTAAIFNPQVWSKINDFIVNILKFGLKT